MKKSQWLVPVLSLALIVLLLGVWAVRRAESKRQAELAAKEQTQTETKEESQQEPDAKAAITESRHYREDAYAADFRTYHLELDGCTVDMDAGIYDEALLRAAGEQLEAELAAMEETVAAPAQKVEVYLVSQTIFGLPQTAGNRVFCTPEDLTELRCRPALAQAAYDLTRTWQAVGLSRYVFEAAPDAKELRSYYEDAAHENLLPLFPLYFFPDFADGETVQMAEQTAQSVTAYALGNGGIDAFRALEQTADAVTPWAQGNGIEMPVLPEGFETVDRLSITGVSDHAIVLQADGEMDHFRFQIQPKDWISTAGDFYPYLCRFYAGYHTLLEQMEQALPTAFEQVRQNAERQITVNFMNTGMVSHAGYGEVRLSSSGASWHEVLHNLLPFSGAASADHWLAEGLAQYFALPIETQYGAYMADMLYSYLTNAEWRVQMTADEKVHLDCILRCYTAHCAMPEQANEIDVAWLYRSFAITTLLQGRVEAGEYTPLMNTRSVSERAGREAGEKEVDGNGLTYPEALLMADYLAEEYGIDHVVSSFLAHESCETAYGMDYPALYQNFFSWVQERYGDLIEDVRA